MTLKLLGLKERTFWRLFTQMTASSVRLVFKESARYIYVYIWLGLLKHGNRNFSHIPLPRLVVEHNICIFFVFCIYLFFLPNINWIEGPQYGFSNPAFPPFFLLNPSILPYFTLESRSRPIFLRDFLLDYWNRRCIRPIPANNCQFWWSRFSTTQ